MSEIELTHAVALGVGQIGQHLLGVSTLRHDFIQIDTGNIGKELVEVNRVDHMLHIAVGLLDQRAGDDQRHPDAGLIGRSLGPSHIKAGLDRGGKGAVITDHDHHGVAGLRIVAQAAVARSGREAGFHQQSSQLGVQGLDQRVGNAALIERRFRGAVGLQRVGPGSRRQVPWRMLQRGMGRAEADGRHPRRIVAAGVDPINGGIDFNGGPVAARAWVSQADILHLSVPVDQQLGNVVRVLSFEVHQTFQLTLLHYLSQTGLPRHQHTALGQALQAGRIAILLPGYLGTTGATARLRNIAGSGMRTARLTWSRHEATGILVLCAHYTCGGINRCRQAAPAVEILPAESCRRSETGRVILRATEMELAKHAILITGGGEDLGNSHHVRRHMGVSQVVWPDRLQHVGAHRIKPGHKGRPARRAFRHGPGVAETDAAIGQGIDGRYRRRPGYIGAAITE